MKAVNRSGILRREISFSKSYAVHVLREWWKLPTVVNVLILKYL